MLNRKKRIISIIKFVIGMLVLLYFLYLLFPRTEVLSDTEIQSFVEGKGIKPKVICNVGESFTAIIYDNKNEMSMYSIYKDKKGTIKEKESAFYESQKPFEEKVEIYGTNPTGNFVGYVTVIIHDKDISMEAEEVTVVLDNKLIETAEFNGNNIVLLAVTKKFFWQRPSLKTVEIFNAAGEVIHGFYTSMEDIPQ